MKTKLLLITLITSLVLLSACAPLTTTPQDTTAQTQGVEATQAQTEATEVPQETTTQMAGELATEEATEQATEEATEAETRPPVDIVNGEFTTNGYAVSQEDGLYYLNFADGNKASSSANGYNEVGLDYKSVKELRDKLLYGTFDENEINHIKLLFPKNTKGISLFNVEKMFDFVHPNEMDSGYVVWSGDTYTKYVSSSKDVMASEAFDARIRVYPRDKYEIRVEQCFKNYFSYINYIDMTVEEGGEWEGLPCDTYVYDTGVAKFKVVFVEIPDDNSGHIKYITIKYLLSHTNSGMGASASDVCPSAVYVFGECDGQPYEIYFTDFADAPTYEALSAYGITPYVE